MADIEKKLEPLRPQNNFGLAKARYRQFDAMVPASVTLEDLTNPTLWTNIAAQVKPGDEIRVTVEDYSFVALLHVTYASGNQLRVKVVYASKLDDVSGVHNADELYEAKLKGPRKWCVVEKATGTVIQELIPTQIAALKEIDDLKRALAA